MIMLAGAERTGKSTLAKAYAEARGLTYIPSRSSQVWTEMGLTPGPLDPKTRVAFQWRVLEAHIEDLKAVKGPAISDRSTLDMLAYLTLDLQGTGFDKKVVDAYAEKCWTTLARFATLVVLVQPGIPYVEEEGKLKRCEIRQEVMNTLISSFMTSPMVIPPVYRLGRSNTTLEGRINSLNLLSAKLIGTATEERSGASLH